MKNLSERKHFLLIQAIEDYIKDASPITSGGVQEKYLKNISTATLRNELNALEAMGYLKQLHTSGGRIPTVEGYKYYVSEILENANIDPNELDGVRESLKARTSSLKEVVSKIAEIVSKATNYPTVIFMDGFDKLIVEQVKIIPLLDGKALVLIKTAGGYLNNTINIPNDEKACHDASAYLSKLFLNKSVGYMMENMHNAVKTCEMEIEGFNNIVESLIEGMKQFMTQPLLDVKTGGSAKLLLENSSEQTQKIFSLLENPENLQKVVKTNSNNVEFEFANEGDDLEGCAIVKAPLIMEGETVASIGVVGPQRMNYASIASALKLIMQETNNKETK